MASPAFIEAGPVLDVLTPGPASGSVVVPASAIDGRFMLLVMRNVKAGATVAAPAGFDPIPSHELTSSFQSDMRLFYRVASTEPASYSVSNGGESLNNGFTAQIFVYEPATFEASAIWAASSGSTTIPCPSVPSGGADRTLICVYGQFGSAVGAMSYGPPSGMLQRANHTATMDTTAQTGYGVADKAVSASGPTGTQNASASSASTWHLAVSVLIQSAGGGTSATATGVTVTATASLIPGAASGAAAGTANGVTLAVGASLIAGAAFAAFGATAAGVTLTAAASLIAGAASAPGRLRFSAAGMEFGRRTGLAVSTFALDVASDYRLSLFADGLTLGNPLLTSTALTTGSDGKLPDYSNALLTSGVTYRVAAVRQADGEAAIFRMVAA